MRSLTLQVSNELNSRSTWKGGKSNRNKATLKNRFFLEALINKFKKRPRKAPRERPQLRASKMLPLCPQTAPPNRRPRPRPPRRRRRRPKRRRPRRTLPPMTITPATATAATTASRMTRTWSSTPSRTLSTTIFVPGKVPDGTTTLMGVFTKDDCYDDEVNTTRRSPPVATTVPPTPCPSIPPCPDCPACPTRCVETPLDCDACPTRPPEVRPTGEIATNHPSIYRYIGGVIKYSIVIAQTIRTGVEEGLVELVQWEICRRVTQ